MMRTTILLTTLALWLGTSTASAQVTQVPGPAAFDTDLFLPLAEPVMFDTDYRLFAPVEIEDLGRLLPPEDGLLRLDQQGSDAG